MDNRATQSVECEDERKVLLMSLARNSDFFISGGNLCEMKSCKLFLYLFSHLF